MTLKKADDFGVSNVLIGLPVGLAAGIGAVEVHGLLDEERTILLTIGGADAALLAVITASIALMVGFLEGLFGRIIEESDGGITGFFFPFRLVAYVSALATFACFGSAIAVDVSGETVRSAFFGLSVGLSAWTVFGTVGLTSAFVRYSTKRRDRITKREKEELEDAEEEEQAQRGLLASGGVGRPAAPSAESHPGSGSPGTRPPDPQA